MALGLKCGGTLEDRANRLFATKGKKLSEIDPSMFAKNKGGKGSGGGGGGSAGSDKEAAKHHGDKNTLTLYVLPTSINVSFNNIQHTSKNLNHLYTTLQEKNYKDYLN